MKRLNPTAVKALSLERDGIFRLLVVMTALLGWVVALGAAGTVMMVNLYGDWRLDREQTLMVYLLPDSESGAVQTLRRNIAALPGVESATDMPAADLAAMLAPYVGSNMTLPLPQVLQVKTGNGFDRALFDPVVTAAFPTAEIDDAQPVLSAVAHGVRMVQTGGVALAFVMAAIMGLLVTLTVRAGLRAQRSTLELLQHLGATHTAIRALVCQQVLDRVLLGWALAGVGAVGIMLGSRFIWPMLADVLVWNVWLVLALAPIALPLVAWLTARTVVDKLLAEHRGEG